MPPGASSVGRFRVIVRALGRGHAVPAWSLAVLAALCSAFYGAVMGSYRAGEPGRWVLIVFGTVKGPLLLLATAGLCVPPFFAINAALGLRRDWPRALRAIAAGQAALSLALASLAPFTRLAYVSGLGHRHAVLFNLAMFTVASLAGQRVIARYYRPLIARSRLHTATLVLWLGLYGFVGVQTAWMLRPFIGTPGRDVTFLREEPFTNAYVALAGLIAPPAARPGPDPTADPTPDPDPSPDSPPPYS